MQCGVKIGFLSKKKTWKNVMGKKDLVKNWWNLNKICNVVDNIVPIFPGFWNCIMVTCGACIRKSRMGNIQESSVLFLQI